MTTPKKFATATDADGNEVIQFIGPGSDNDPISVGLRILTFMLQQRDPEKDHGGGLFGGPFGYGVTFENDVFAMQRFCYHDDDPCPCGDRPNFLHKASGFTVRWYKYIGRDNELSDKALTGPQWLDILTTSLASIGAASLESAVQAFTAAEEEADKAAKRQMEWMQSDEGRAFMREMMKSVKVITFGQKGDGE